jgi:hypothetical protein
MAAVLVAGSVPKMEKFGHLMYNICISVKGLACSIEDKRFEKGFTGRDESIAG